MKKLGNHDPIRSRNRRFATAFAVSLITALPSFSLAATATINFGFASPESQAVDAIVNPTNPTKTSASPVFTTIQSNTELNTVAPTTPAGEAPKTAAPTKLPKAAIGVDTYFSDDLKIYNIPLSYTLTPTLYAQVNVPIVTAKFEGAEAETGLGDVSLTMKHRLGTEQTLEIFSLLTGKFASGDKEKGLGTGTYDISLTEKAIRRFGDYRLTLMGGVTQPLNNPTVRGFKVEYGTNISYMASVEHPIFLPNLWFGVRGAGIHAFETKINSISQNNALTTLDVIPEFKFYTSNYTAMQLAVIVPAYTAYDLPGGSNKRDLIINFGLFKAF